MELMNQAAPPSVGIMKAEEAREITEAMAKIRVAKAFPRDANLATSYITEECKNKDLAAVATYEYPRGSEKVTGPSIRLIEVVARYWGNMMSSVRELSRVEKPDPRLGKIEVATVRAYAWDMETNFMDEKVFDVPLVRTTKKGSYALTDPRDQYELIANMGARRKRACIQAVIPRWVVDKAVERCNETLTDDKNDETLDDRKSAMLKAFKKHGDWITMEHLAAYVEKEPDKISVKDLARLGRVYNAIQEGFTKPEAAFGIADQAQQHAEDQEAAKDLTGRILGGDGK